MFSKATAKFVRQVDPEGSLIHVSRVNDSHKLLPMAIVVKRNRVLMWQRPKYQPTDFSLGDLLQGNQVLRPVTETEFLTYKGTFKGEHSGKLDTEAGPADLSLESLGFSRLEFCFGKLKKEELDVKKLLEDSKSRLVDMQHVLVQQLQKHTEVLTVVKERIVTTNPCSINLTKKQQYTFKGVLKLFSLLGRSLKVSGKDIDLFEVDKDVSLEIPPGTVIAYSTMELEIEKNGHYDIRLQPGTTGGFKSDSIPFHDCFDSVDGQDLRHGGPETVLSRLAELHQSTRRGLVEKLQEVLRDRAALCFMQNMLEKLCDGETVQTPVINEKETNSLPIVDLMESCCLSEDGPTCPSLHLDLFYGLVSAMEELPDETLNILSSCRPDFLKGFDALIRGLKDSRGKLSVQYIPANLQDNQVFQQAEQLLRSVGVTLQRDSEVLHMEADPFKEVPLLLLGVSVHGLALLCTDLC
ncbi:PREDICTED: non-syndromic hearing impairment protein 5-like isoform X2 [Cyprinodon variegatus]|uniref:non-syndromic hearing impairment protein 5-like isoform X2 n=1 Tax=Cyprinodon variegatus TaxID=28743 RepID=UPI000742CA1A|nr:PREDICTED: non-syndromic hearing impairment protein 5-like isoform X2 [Cyprinodon variegatus]